MKTTSAEDTLFSIAAEQGGYFTAFQAQAAGYTATNHPYHVTVGNWIREWRGIYRLSRFPLQADTLYSLWGVWSINHKGTFLGVYSHETALALHELSDLQPEKMHMTVPRGYRRHSEVPNVLQLHFISLSPDECEKRNGYLVTNPDRTIIDILQEGSVSPEFIRQAVTQALDRGLITRSRYRSMVEMKRVGRKLKQIMGEGE